MASTQSLHTIIKPVSIQCYVPIVSNGIPYSSIPMLGQKTGPIRVHIDGCFDVMHFGHANALRQAKALGDESLVGVVSSAEMAIHKGPSVMGDDGRVAVATSMKWVNEILGNDPYVLNDEFLPTLIDRHCTDIIVCDRNFIILTIIIIL